MDSESKWYILTGYWMSGCTLWYPSFETLVSGSEAFRFTNTSTCPPLLFHSVDELGVRSAGVGSGEQVVGQGSRLPPESLGQVGSSAPTGY